MHLSRLQELADLIVADEELPEKTAATDRADLTEVITSMDSAPT
jgi:hypothetical protein